MLNIRNLNEGIDLKREELFEEYLDAKYSKFQLKSLADYDQLKKVNNARRNTRPMRRNLTKGLRSLQTAKGMSYVRLILICRL